MYLNSNGKINNSIIFKKKSLYNNAHMRLYRGTFEEEKKSSPRR
jgi:hypothetical protein